MIAERIADQASLERQAAMLAAFEVWAEVAADLEVEARRAGDDGNAAYRADQRRRANAYAETIRDRLADLSGLTVEDLEPGDDHGTEPEHWCLWEAIGDVAAFAGRAWRFVAAEVTFVVAIAGLWSLVAIEAVRVVWSRAVGSLGWAR